MIDELRTALEADKKDSGLIIGRHANTVWYKINSICEKNGLPNVGIHGLRHSFVSLAYHLGVPEKIVMEIGGWSDYQTMRNIYTHIARSDVARYRDEIANEHAVIDRLLYVQECRNSLERCIGSGAARLRYRWRDGRVTETRFRRTSPGRVRVSGLLTGPALRAAG